MHDKFILEVRVRVRFRIRVRVRVRVRIRVRVGGRVWGRVVGLRHYKFLLEVHLLEERLGAHGRVGRRVHPRASCRGEA